MEVNKILKNTLIGGLFLAPFIPFIVLGSMFFPFITGKNFAFRFLVEILLLLWAVLAIRDASFRPKLGPLFISLAAFLGVMGLATIFSEFPLRSFWSNFERMEGFVTLIHLGAYFTLLATVFRTEKIWDLFLKVTLGASVLMAFYALLQLFGFAEIHQSGVRLDGRLGNATYLAVYMIFHIFIALLLLFKSIGQTRIQILYGFIIALELFVLFYTATRGAILGIIGGLLLTAIIIVFFEKERRILKKIAIGILGAVILIVGLFFALKDSSFVTSHPVLSRFSSISLEERTTVSRFMVWDMAWQGFKERPILGWGQESFNYVFNKYYNPKMYGQEPWFDRTHNVFLDWLIAGGILGLFTYLSLFGIAFWYIWFSKRFSVTEKAVLTGMLAAYFFHNLFVFDNLVSYMMFIMFLSYFHFRVVGVREALPPQNPKTEDVSKNVIQYVSVPVLVAMFLAGSYFFVAKGVMASATLIDAISFRGSSFDANIEYFKKALSYNSFANQEIREQILQATVGLRDSQLELPLKQKLFNLARSEFQKMTEESPNDARHHLFYGTLLNSYNFPNEALLELQKALELSPNKQHIMFEIGSTYLNLGRPDEALAVLKKAYELEPAFEEARVVYVSALIYSGDFATADKILENITDSSKVDLRIMRAYFDTKNYQKAIRVINGVLEKDPGNGDLRLRLAQAYYLSGNGQKAIAEIKIIMEKDPGFKAQGEAIIKEIQGGK